MKTIMVVSQKRFSSTIPLPRLFLRRTWKSNFNKILRSKCLHSLNILKFLSHPCVPVVTNRKLLLQLYNTLIRSQVDNAGLDLQQHQRIILKTTSICSISSRTKSGPRWTADQSHSQPVCQGRRPHLNYCHRTFNANFL